MEERVGFQVGRDQRHAPVSILWGDVVTDGPAFEEDKSIIVLDTKSDDEEVEQK